MTRRGVLADAWTILRERGHLMVLPTLAAGVGFVGVVTIPVGGLLLARAAAATEPTAPPGGSLNPGWLSVLTVLPFLGSLAIGARLGVSFDTGADGMAIGILLQFGVATLGGAAMAPLLGAPLVAIRGAKTLQEAVARSLAISASRGWATTAAAGAVHGAVLSVPVALFVASGSSVVAMLTSCVAWVIALAIACALGREPDAARPCRRLCGSRRPTFAAVWVSTDCRSWPSKGGRASR